MIGYLGPEGTFSHIAAKAFCGGEELAEYATIYSAIMAVNDGKIDGCIVPIENSIEGSVNITLDTLVSDADVYITGEYILRIDQNLIVNPGTKKEDIKVIYSHTQAIGQCAKMLNNDFPDAEIIFTESTAKAAELVKSGNTHCAAIGSERGALLNGLEILIPNCNDLDNNSTRFVMLEKSKSNKVTENDKSSIAFTLKNESGALYRALSDFDRYNLNMIKIESRPVKTHFGQYIFFIDIDGNIDDANIYFALENIRKNTTSFKFLGSYEKYKA